MKLDLDSISLQIYRSQYDTAVAQAIRQLVRPGDVVFDVGANIGYLSAVAADCVGETGFIHTFEPIPQLFRALCHFAEENPRYQIITNQVAVGEHTGHATMLMSLTNMGGHTALSGLQVLDDLADTIEVPMITLDDYIEAKKIAKIAFIKIDVEGFEFPVLKGLGRFLASGHRPAMLAEISARAYPLLGCRIDELAHFMRSFGYRAFSPTHIGADPIDITTIAQADVVFRV